MFLRSVVKFKRLLDSVRISLEFQKDMNHLTPVGQSSDGCSSKNGSKMGLKHMRDSFLTKSQKRIKKALLIHRSFNNTSISEYSKNTTRSSFLIADCPSFSKRPKRRFIVPRSLGARIDDPFALHRSRVTASRLYSSKRLFKGVINVRCRSRSSSSPKTRLIKALYRSHMPAYKPPQKKVLFTLKKQQKRAVPFHTVGDFRDVKKGLFLKKTKA